MQPRAAPTHPMGRGDWGIPSSFPNHLPHCALVTPYILVYLFSLVFSPTLLLHTLGSELAQAAEGWTSSRQTL